VRSADLQNMSAPPASYSASAMVRVEFPSALRYVGWFSLAGTSCLAARLIYEQTYLTWTQGAQMVGFALAHAYAHFLILGLVCLLVSAIVLLALLANVLLRRPTVAAKDWVLMGLLIPVIVSVFIPYGIWIELTVRLFGPGPHSQSLLSQAVGADDYRLTRFLIKRGVQIDPSVFRVHTVLAHGLKQEGDLDGAIAEYRMAIASQPNDAESYVGLAAVLEQKGDPKAALEQYQLGCVQFGGEPACKLAQDLERKLARMR
jgi:tetratricopeptide (TPR) repeat protein